jgi:hypothetical protein
MKFRNNILFALARCFGFLLQGTWFWQVGFILYNPDPSHTPWDPENRENLRLVDLFYACHVTTDFLLIVCIGGVVGCIHHSFEKYDGDDEFFVKRPIFKGINGHSLISMHDDYESDM